MTTPYGMASMVIVCFFIGYAVDNLFGSSNGYFILLFVLIGVIAIFYQAYRALVLMDDNHKKDEK